MHHQGCFLNEAPAFFSSCKCCMFLQILARIANTRRIEQVHLTWVTSNARLITIHTCFLLSHFVVSYSTASVWSMSMRHTAYLVSLFNFWLTTKVGPFHVAAGRGVSQRDIAGIGLEINIVEGVFACRVVLFFSPQIQACICRKCICMWNAISHHHVNDPVACPHEVSKILVFRPQSK